MFPEPESCYMENPREEGLLGGGNGEITKSKQSCLMEFILLLQLYLGIMYVFSGGSNQKPSFEYLDFAFLNLPKQR